MSPPGTALLPLAPTASVADVESKVSTTLEQLLVAQSWKVIVPVSWPSGSANAALSVGVKDVRIAPPAGEPSDGVDGDWFAVPFVICAFASEAVAAALPAGTAVSRITLPEPGFVYVTESESRWWTGLASVSRVSFAAG